MKWWEETGRDLLEKARAKAARDRAAAHRIVVVGRIMPIKAELPPSLVKKIPDGFQLPIPNRKGLRPQAYGTVVKETDKRVYLEDVMQMMPLSPYDCSSVLQGQRGLGTFVDREHVILDNASVGVAEKLYALDMEYQEDVNRIATDFAERMLPIVQEMASRMAQKDSERDEVIKQTIDDFVRSQQDPAQKRTR